MSSEFNIFLIPNSKSCEFENREDKSDFIKSHSIENIVKVSDAAYRQIQELAIPYGSPLKREIFFRIRHLGVEFLAQANLFTPLTLLGMVSFEKFILKFENAFSKLELSTRESRMELRTLKTELYALGQLDIKKIDPDTFELIQYRLRNRENGAFNKKVQEIKNMTGNHAYDYKTYVNEKPYLAKVAFFDSIKIALKPLDEVLSTMIKGSKSEEEALQIVNSLKRFDLQNEGQEETQNTLITVEEMREYFLISASLKFNSQFNDVKYRKVKLGSKNLIAKFFAPTENRYCMEISTILPLQKKYEQFCELVDASPDVENYPSHIMEQFCQPCSDIDLTQITEFILHGITYYFSDELIEGMNNLRGEDHHIPLSCLVQTVEKKRKNIKDILKKEKRVDFYLAAGSKILNVVFLPTIHPNAYTILTAYYVQISTLKYRLGLLQEHDYDKWVEKLSVLDLKSAL